ncbi:ribonuclease Z [Clostridium carnis]
MLDICLLGTGGGMPMPYRNLSATLLNYKGRKILIDCGEGTQVSMRMIGWGFKSVDIICITHCHGDHIVGLPGLLSTIGNSGRIKPLTIIGPSGINDVIDGLRVIIPYLPYEIKIIENKRTMYFNENKEGFLLNKDNGDLIIKTIELEHSSPCIGFNFYFKRSRKFDVEKAIRLNVPKILWSKLQREKSVILDNIEYKDEMVLGEERKGIKISLITDSRPLEKIPLFIEKSDLFICEGTYGDDNDIDKAVKNKHMTFSEAGDIAKKGNVKELLLTHFSPAMLEPEKYIENSKANFNNTILGTDRLIKTLKFLDN